MVTVQWTNIEGETTRVENVTPFAKNVRLADRAKHRDAIIRCPHCESELFSTYGYQDEENRIHFMAECESCLNLYEFGGNLYNLIIGKDE